MSRPKYLRESRLSAWRSRPLPKRRLAHLYHWQDHLLPNLARRRRPASSLVLSSAPPQPPGPPKDAATPTLDPPPVLPIAAPATPSQLAALILSQLPVPQPVKPQSAATADGSTAETHAPASKQPSLGNTQTGFTPTISAPPVSTSPPATSSTSTSSPANSSSGSPPATTSSTPTAPPTHPVPPPAGEPSAIGAAINSQLAHRVPQSDSPPKNQDGSGPATTARDVGRPTGAGNKTADTTVTQAPPSTGSAVPAAPSLPSIHATTPASAEPSGSVAPQAVVPVNQNSGNPLPAAPAGQTPPPLPSAGHPPALPAAAGDVQMARLVDRAGQAEMHIDLRTSSFGSVEVHTVIRDSQVGVVVGSERGDLRTLMAAEMPNLQTAFRQHDLGFDQIRFLGHGASMGAGLTAGSDSQSRSFAQEHGLSAGVQSFGNTRKESLEPEAVVSSKSGSQCTCMTRND